MKIGFDAKRLFNNFTGLGNYSRFIVSALSENFPENEYKLYAPKARHHPEVDALVRQASIEVKLPSPIISALKLASVWRSYSLGRIADQDGVQIFHGLSNELPLTKPKSLKTVLTVHDLIFKRFPEFYKPIDIQIYNWKLKKASQSADKIIAISKQTAGDLVEFFQVDPSRIEVVYQGCHPNFKEVFAAQQLNEIKLRYQLPSEYILNVGTIESRKNVLALLQSLKQVKHELPVLVVGKATPYIKILKDYIEANKLESRVRFIHNAAFADLPAIYQLAKVFVYPSLFEGFGIPIVEAISSGVPVITSQGSCFSEAGGPDCMYVDARKPEQLAEALNSILSADGKAKQMADKSRVYIERFQPRQIAADLMGVYRTLV